jgi:hypothetical protein
VTAPRDQRLHRAQRRSGGHFSPASPINGALRPLAVLRWVFRGTISRAWPRPGLKAVRRSARLGSGTLRTGFWGTRAGLVDWPRLSKSLVGRHRRYRRRRCAWPHRGRRPAFSVNAICWCCGAITGPKGRRKSTSKRWISSECGRRAMSVTAKPRSPSASEVEMMRRDIGRCRQAQACRQARRLTANLGGCTHGRKFGKAASARD